VWNFWTGGFFSVPALSEVEQQSLIVALLGEQLSSVCLVALRLIRLVHRLIGAAKRPHLRVYYAAVAAVFCASLVFTWCILGETLYIYDVYGSARLPRSTRPRPQSRRAFISQPRGDTWPSWAAWPAATSWGP
jgi:hypothetical protein